MRHRRCVRSLGVAGLVATVLAAVGATPAFALSSLADSGTWQTNGKVLAMTRVGNTLFIGGKFTKVTGPGQSLAAVNLAAIDMTTGAAIPTFSASATHSTVTPQVHALGTSPDGSILYIGGSFDAVDGVARNNLAAVSTQTGDIVFGFAPNVNKIVHTIVVDPSGKVYFGGAFKQVDGQSRNRLALVAPDGTLDPTWVPNANDVVRTIVFAEDHNTIFVGGNFTTMDGVARQSVARVSTDTGALNPWAIPAGVINTPQTAWALLPRGTRLYGGFGRGPNYVAAFHLDTGTTGSQVWRFNTVGNDESLAMPSNGSRLFVGGHFGTAVLQQTVCGGINLRGLMSLNPATGAIFCDWIPQIAPYGNNFTGVWDMLITDTQLWVGGLISTIGGIPHKGIARFTL